MGVDALIADDCASGKEIHMSVLRTVNSYRHCPKAYLGKRIGLVESSL
jgi:hypothetical protein